MFGRRGVRPVGTRLLGCGIIGLLVSALSVPSPGHAGDRDADASWGIWRTPEDISRSSTESMFDGNGALRWVHPGTCDPTEPDLQSRQFNPGVRVDDDLSPEHREPAVTWGPDGNLYAAYCERAVHYNPEQIMFTMSADDGQTWLEQAVQVNDTSPNAVAFPAIGTLNTGTIVVVWCELKFAPYNYEIRFSRSPNGGASWTRSVVIHPLDPSTDYYRPSLLVAENRILVSYWEEVAYPNGRPVVVYSDDGGATWSGPIVITTTLCPYDGGAPCLAYNQDLDEVGVVMATAANQIIFCRSSDLGVTWSAPVEVNDAAAGSVDYPDLDCGGGNYHVVWNDNRSGQYDTDVYASRSSDGQTFSPSVRVNDSFAGNQYEPHIRGGPDGMIHVCWIWNMPFQSNIDLYYSASEDDGLTWLQPCPRVNGIPYIVQPYVAWTSDLLGDNQGNTFVFWNDGRATDYYDNIYVSSTLDPTRVGATSAPSFTQAALLPPVPNPFNPATTIRFVLPKAGAARLAVHDVTGRRVLLLFQGYRDAGEHELMWDGRDESGCEISSGVYFVAMEAHGATITRKMVCLK